MEGIIKSVTPEMENGKHKTWSQNGKTYYRFNIEFEDGTKGSASGQKDTFRFDNGNEVTYNTKNTQGGLYISVTGLTENSKAGRPQPSGSGSTFSKSSYNDPETVKARAFGLMQEAAIQQFKNTEKTITDLNHINVLATYYFKWVTADIPETEPKYADKVSAKQYAILRAVECISITESTIKTKEQVLGTAAIFLSANGH
jgi:uncharacterized membrane protein YkoI